MNEEYEIKNRVADSGLMNFDISELLPKGQRTGIDLKDFLYEGLILKEKDFREKIKNLEVQQYQGHFVYIYNSADAIVPLWAYFLLTSKLAEAAQKVVYGDRQQLEVLLMHDALRDYNFEAFRDKRVLVKGCSDNTIPENAYVELVEILRPVVKALMFGEACSNVPILKN